MYVRPLESLESRTLLTVTLDNGLLTIIGTDAADLIQVNQNGADIEVELNALTTPFDANLVNRIRIEGLGEADAINVNVNRPTTILGGAGNDNILGSDGGSDDVFGNTGADTFSGRGGDDKFTWNPGDGNDVINGDAGNDYAEGGLGNDAISGGADNDTLLGQHGNDFLNGGAGFDYLYGGADADTFSFRRGDSYDTAWDFSAAEGDKLRIDPATGVTNFAQFQALLTGFAFDAGDGRGVVEYSVLNVAALGSNDQITISGLRPVDWTVGMVEFL
jgi:Ca2+-binding RTX toxin-like protein